MTIPYYMEIMGVDRPDRTYTNYLLTGMILQVVAAPPFLSLDSPNDLPHVWQLWPGWGRPSPAHSVEHG